MEFFDSRSVASAPEQFAEVWEQTEVTTRLVVSYFNWIWEHSRCRTIAAQRAGLINQRWTWHDLAIYATLRRSTTVLI